MKKEFRVKTNQDFQKVFNSKKVNGTSFAIHYCKHEYEHPRFGVSASKKLGNAVFRTTTRRQVRSMLQNILKNSEIENLDYIVIVRKKYCEKTFQENFDELNKLFQIIRRKI